MVTYSLFSNIVYNICTLSRGFPRRSAPACQLLFVIWNEKWAAARQNQQNDMYAHQRLSSAWTSAQSDQSSLCAHWLAKDPSFLHADSEDSDHTGRMPRLIWVFTGRTYHCVGFVMRRLKRSFGLLGDEPWLLCSPCLANNKQQKKKKKKKKKKRLNPRIQIMKKFDMSMLRATSLYDNVSQWFLATHLISKTVPSWDKSLGVCGPDACCGRCALNWSCTSVEIIQSVYSLRNENVHEMQQSYKSSHTVNKKIISNIVTLWYRFWSELICIKWASSWENLFMPYANNKGADQPALPRSLISTFVFAAWIV